MFKIFSIIIASTVILFSYQNCAVYQSEGREQLDEFFSSLNNNCLPLLDINIASEVLGTSDLTLVKENGGCTVKVNGNRGEDRYEYRCVVSDEIKTYDVDPVNSGSPSYTAYYNGYCAGDASGTFACEDSVANSGGTCDETVGVNARYCLATNLVGTSDSSLSPNTALLAYFKFLPSELAGNIGYGYAEYYGSQVQAHALLANNSVGVDCSVSLTRRADISQINDQSARAQDYDQITSDGAANTSDVTKVRELAIAILRQL